MPPIRSQSSKNLIEREDITSITSTTRVYKVPCSTLRDRLYARNYLSSFSRRKLGNKLYKKTPSFILSVFETFDSLLKD
ncbi:hypothetical protein N7519_001714 [Penicillium mononematosum]|uniref:uncharacterized protein n=1 Tax=Penicillium mononematosum TaxID=268346 RepID=UPI002546A547|nr:uncharacterized protein N7519_001714 [Penicillium mononematosum]KAJ6191693.1 hypothetical protein N7519_001714 [Penicillium mononematosum]